MYIIGRGDLPLNIQAVQNGHASLDFTFEHPEVAKDWNQNSNYLIYLTARDEEELEQLLQKAQFRGIRTTSFREPDINNELTAIALEPSQLSRKLVSSLPLMCEPEPIDYDFVVPLIPTKSFKVKTKVKSITKYMPKVFIEGANEGANEGVK